MVLVLAVVALGLVATPSAQSASNSECLGHKPNVFGTSGNDTISVYADEAGARVFVNGKRTFLEDWDGPITIWSKAGADTISFSSDGGGGAVICSGDGDDVIDTTMTSRIHTGSGYDRVNEYLQCGGTAEVFKAEIVRVRYDTTHDEGPCN